MTRHNRRFQIFANSILLLMAAGIVLPFLLLFMSSITEENTLIQNGYSFGRKHSVWRLIPIYGTKEDRFSGHMGLP